MEITKPIKDMGFEERLPKTLQYLLHILKKSEGYKLYSKTMWAKILFLIETEGHVQLDTQITMDNYGPYPREEVVYAIGNGLVSETERIGITHNCKEVTLTDHGLQVYNTSCLPYMDLKEVAKADKIIHKYINKDYLFVVEQVYTNYVDPFRDKNAEKRVLKLKNLNERLILVANNASKLCNLDDEQGSLQFSLLGKLQHISISISKLQQIEDPVILSVIYNSITNIVNLLGENDYLYTITFDEEFEFLDHYLSKHNILRSITDEDLSDVSEGSLELMSQITDQVLQQMYM